MSDPALWIALLAAVGSCYFAACNIALKSFNRKRLSELLEAAGRADRMAPFLARRARLLLMTGTIRACLNFVVLLAMVNLFGRRLGDATLWVQYLAAFLVAGMLVSVFAVAIAHSWARYQPEKLLARSMPFLNACMAAVSPIIATLHVFDPIVRRICGADLSHQNEDEELSDQILSVVEEHNGVSGGVDDTQKQMLEAVVEFPATTVGRIMTPRTDVRGLPVDASLEQIKHYVREEGHSRIPVYEDSLDHILGILYVKDLIQFIGNGQSFELRRVLRQAMMVPETKSVRELLAEFKMKKVHIAIVLDEYGGTAGLVTIEDIIEEIVGEIQDEYEPNEQEPTIRRLDDTTFEADARVAIDDLDDEVHLDLPRDRDYDTVGGFVFATLGHIPEVGEHFEFNQLRFTVTDAGRTKVNRVRIERLEPQPTSKDNGPET